MGTLIDGLANQLVLTINIILALTTIFDPETLPNNNEQYLYQYCKPLSEYSYLITGFEIGSKTYENFKLQTDYPNANVKWNIFDSNNNVLQENSDEIIATGQYLQLDDYTDESIKSTIVIFGDVNGDGDINSVDALAVIKHKLGVLTIENEANIEAGRVTTNTRSIEGTPSAIDALAIVKYKLMPDEYLIDQKFFVSDTTTKPEIPDEPNENKDYLTPVELHGKLSVNGKNLVDKNGEKFQLKGVSTHGIAWFPQYVNQEAFEYMRDEWGINVVRIAMYSNPNEGYSRDAWNTVKNGVEYATNAGIYVIIDWHVLNECDPNIYKSEAIEFFKEMTALYKNNNNVIYEICNEPNGGVTWNEKIKPYAEEVIGEIRKVDTDAIIICGTPTWSQDVDIVAQNPITDYSNIMYALHFYADTHKESYRNKLETALNNGLPVFVSEFSICDASGNGAINIEEANTWMSLLNKNNISYVAWSLCNKNESASILVPSTNKLTGWTEDELSQTGKWLVKTFKSAKIYYHFENNNLTIKVKDGNGIKNIVSTVNINGKETKYVFAQNENTIKNKKGNIIEMQCTFSLREIDAIISETTQGGAEVTTVITENDENVITFKKNYVYVVNSGIVTVNGI